MTECSEAFEATEREKTSTRLLPESVLPAFLPGKWLPRGDEETRKILRSDRIKEVRNFVLGPAGTNISQAAPRWARRMGIEHKSTIHLCETPEHSVLEARRVTDADVLATFWTCAVFSRQKDLFFDNPDTFPFFAMEIMELDEMQFAAHPSLAEQWRNREASINWRIASHPSPAPLVKGLRMRMVLVESNSVAAKVCAEGEVEACITTENARKIHGLETLHDFGSPPMVFFAGITEQGAGLVASLQEEQGFPGPEQDLAVADPLPVQEGEPAHG